MRSYIIRRVLQVIPVAIIISLICFVIFQYMGDPVVAILGQNATQIERAEVRKSLGLDKPFLTQYFIFLNNILHGNFGISYVRGQSVLTIILERIPATVELATISMIMALILGVSLGVMAAVKPDSIFSKITMTASLLGISMPTFLGGILLIMFFAVYLNVLPSCGRGDVVKIGFWTTGFLTKSGLAHLILPAIALSLYELAVLLRLSRGAMMEVLEEDYIRTARAKGLPESIVVFKHALRNAFFPILTIGGLQYGELLAFTLIIAKIFQWPGLGPLFLDAVYGGDRPIIVAYIIIASFIILFINLAVDILYGVINPEVRYD